MSLNLDIQSNPAARDFCRVFSSALPEQRFILGRNLYGKSIAEKIEISAFIDDFTTDSSFLGKPVIRSSDIPPEALVVSSLLGRPASGARKLDEVGARHLDYFAFYEECGLDLPALRFWGSFKSEYFQNSDRFEWVYTLLSDDESVTVYSDILRFRLSGNLEYMKHFNDREKLQYFEDFLELNEDGEVFVDAGGFDGFTSCEFIKRCPQYECIYFLEPDPNNMVAAANNLAPYPNINLIQAGLADKKGIARFSSGGSVSTINNTGDLEIKVDRLDSLVSGKVTFFKMDIEGEEKNALVGAKNTILTSHPKLAIAAYHLDDDFWRIPELVLSIREDYRIYLRHYTEGVAETIMFFVPE